MRRTGGGEAGAYFPPETVKRIAEDIGPEKIDFDCDAIFVCFDEHEQARLLTMDRFGRIREATSNAFAVIGAGLVAATSHLYARQYGYLETLPRALYYVFEAKKKSESEVTVGPDTHMMVADPQDFLWVDPSGVEFLEEEYKKRNEVPELDLPDYFWMEMEGYTGTIERNNAETNDPSTPSS